MENNYCEKCKRFMGNIEEPICHQCEVEEIDALRVKGLDRYGYPLEF